MTHELSESLKQDAPRAMFETEIIGALLYDPGRLVEVRAWLLPAHFAPGPLRAAYEALLSAPPSDQVANVWLVSEAVQGGAAEQSAARLAMVDAVTTVTGTSYLLHFAKRLAGIHTLEQIGGVAAKIQRDAADAAPFQVTEILEGAKDDLDEIEPPTGAATVHTLDHHSFDVPEGGYVPTGNPDLDRALTGGGLHPCNLVVLAAGSGIGKTTMMSTLAAAVPRRPLFISLEMSGDELRLRCREELWSHLIFTTEAKTLVQIETLTRAMRIQKGITHVFIDYLQIIDAGARKNRSDSREQEVAGIAKHLKAMAMDLSIVVVTGSQVNDAGEVRESKAILQTADIVLTMTDGKNADERHMTVTKQRNGPAHQSFKLKLCTNPLRFEAAALGTDLMSDSGRDDGYQSNRRRTRGNEWENH